MFDEIHVERLLHILIFGESLLNGKLCTYMYACMYVCIVYMCNIPYCLELPPVSYSCRFLF